MFHLHKLLLGMMYINYLIPQPCMGIRCARNVKQQQRHTVIARQCGYEYMSVLWLSSMLYSSVILLYYLWISISLGYKNNSILANEQNTLSVKNQYRYPLRYVQKNYHTDEFMAKSIITGYVIVRIHHGHANKKK